ncbi:hypothetical protein P153DRAFT_363083 [Dothidotthia symphoricarpi CBS 119687]|uniref:Uncharacterized protein n=1 Tax=Dothidotthia symphoricarpi CBS 119687 TaxID=1392245 RepID=A0A6A6AQ06_9PLEO|nr:uncharacterized protein P153DRAFT_363083 [Dothidotthia symphoricarpi CBS 119687]KAF2134082.1 hypothetical protein P153DRAFT_363083 [Dothidotthia symphoricarpi CBS 119687]
MHAFKIAALAIAAMASAVVADNCFEGYLYCSANLKSQGDYTSTIHNALAARGQPTDQGAVNKALFACLLDGEIAFTQMCRGDCINEPFGTQRNDHC